MTRQELGLAPDELDMLDRDSERLLKTSPKIYQVMQAAREAGVRPAYILYSLRGGGDNSYENLKTPADAYIMAAHIVSSTVRNEDDELPGVYIDQFFRQHVQKVQTLPGVNPALVRQTFEVLRTVYPERTADIPLVVQ